MLGLFSCSEIFYCLVWEEGLLETDLRKPNFLTNWISIFCCLLRNPQRVVYSKWIFFFNLNKILASKTHKDSQTVEVQYSYLFEEYFEHVNDIHMR